MFPDKESPLHHHLHLHRRPTGGRKEKKINGFSISQLSAPTTACESPFSGSGWLTGTSIWENLYKTHYCATCHRTIPGEGGGAEGLELIGAFTCELSHLLSPLLNRPGLIFTSEGVDTGHPSSLYFSCGNTISSSLILLLSFSSLPGSHEVPAAFPVTSRMIPTSPRRSLDCFLRPVDDGVAVSSFESRSSLRWSRGSEQRLVLTLAWETIFPMQAHRHTHTPFLISRSPQCAVSQCNLVGPVLRYFQI